MCDEHSFVVCVLSFQWKHCMWCVLYVQRVHCKQYMYVYCVMNTFYAVLFYVQWTNFIQCVLGRINTWYICYMCSDYIVCSVSKVQWTHCKQCVLYVPWIHSSPCVLRTIVAIVLFIWTISALPYFQRVWSNLRRKRNMSSWK
jgi:hypothetical protein